MAGEAKVKIKLVRSPIGVPGKLKKVVQGLGLTRMGRVVERPDDDATWGMIKKVAHLVEVER